MQEKLNELNQQINEQGFQQGNNRPGGFGQGAYVSQLISQRNMIRMNLDEIVSTQKSVKADAETDPKTLEAESKKSLEAAKAVLTEFRESVDAVTKQYDELERRRIGQIGAAGAGERQGGHLQTRPFLDLQGHGEGCSRTPNG